jgi:broad specificity phosphatase PhoE
MTELIVLRHAPTVWNREKRLQGRTDVALDEDAVAIAARWRVVPDWRAYPLLVSPLMRTRMTASILFPDSPQRIEPRLIEMSFGEWEGKRLRDLRQESGADAATREGLGIDFRAPGGESPREVQERLRPLLENLARLGRPSIAVTHKAVIRALYALATGWTMLEKPPHRLRDHCAQIFDLAGDGTLAIKDLNCSLVEAD